ESYDNAEFFENYIFTAKNCADIARETVMNIASFIAFSLGGIMGISMIVNIDPIMTVLIMLSIGIAFLVSWFKEKLDYQYQDRLAGVQAKEDYIQRVFYMKEYAKELRSIQKLPGFLLKMFREIEEENIRLTDEYGKKILYLSILSHINTRTLMYWGAMLLTIHLIERKGTIEPGNLLIMTVSIGTVALLIQAIVDTIPKMNQIMLFQQKIERFQEKAADKSKTGKTVIREIHLIRFEHVSFTYPNEERPILNDISFEVRKNEQIAIVGNNGAGKSTIMKLLLKFYVPDKGAIYINDIDIRKIDENSCREAFGSVFQDVNLFAMPVFQNITWEQNIDDWDRLKTVLEESGLSGQFPDRESCYKEITKELSEDGVVLSGGNVQKTAIARALYQDVSVLLFDEATSAVDMETEQDIMKGVQKAGKDRITLLISHKLSCVRNADRIFFLENGIIVEEGNHQELTKKKGRYFELFQKQAQQIQKLAKEQELRQKEWL
ncbi:MAG: ABC transporter ATP-binding protein, partial [Clostridia bacterium]|nr:ABC transporter ATP-binding protein [Clostridia bacterium]